MSDGLTKSQRPKKARVATGFKTIRAAWKDHSLKPKMGVLSVTYPDADVTVSIDADEIVYLPLTEFNKLLRRVK